MKANLNHELAFLCACVIVCFFADGVNVAHDADARSAAGEPQATVQEGDGP